MLLHSRYIPFDMWDCPRPLLPHFFLPGRLRLESKASTPNLRSGFTSSLSTPYICLEFNLVLRFGDFCAYPSVHNHSSLSCRPLTPPLAGVFEAKKGTHKTKQTHTSDKTQDFHRPRAIPIPCSGDSEMAATVADIAELAKLCSSRDGSEAILI